MSYVRASAAPPSSVSSSASCDTTVPLAISALSLCAENHHTFVGTANGGLSILANPIINIQVLEQIAGELLNL